ncbi:GCN5 family acetyltransferase [Aeromicrobium sp. Root495]|uniref:GNAT family N-acetyltransferase n=1 Tax=Aeromicrobium sp. Root495 TaxID=1736550 RepID=UPI0006FCABEF|nr:GNAT family N-acetyltransferase [Aeromicrobium sp. Root495]KQY55330.1 GCN5 family acetyltransferase [Aeromicrobium sp. Root495]
MLALLPPSVDLHASWLRARAEWPTGHQDGSGLRPDDLVETPEGFSSWLDRLRREADGETRPGSGQVPSTRWWIVEESEYLGVIELRHELTPAMIDGVGHVGYSVRPSARGRGVATWALRETLPHAWSLGLPSVLVTCDEGNEASARTIERNGGVLEDVRDTARGRKRRYWISGPEPRPRL